MHETELFLGLLVAITVLAGVARLVHVPYPLVGLVGGLVLDVIPGLPTPRLDPQLVFLIFLPPLLYSAAFLTPPAELRDRAGPISLLAIGLVVVTLVAVAAVAHALLGVSWVVAFVLGAVLSPTDSVTAVTVLRRLGGPQDVTTVLEGEALINDGTGLTAYKVAVAAVGGSFALSGAVGQFFAISAGGIAVGLAAGQVSVWVRRRISAGDVETTFSLLTPFLAYIPAEELGVSGVLAAVAAGLVVGARSESLSVPATRVNARGFWEVLTFILESALFLLVGLEVPGVVASVQVGGGELVLDIAVLTAALTAVRIPYVFLVSRGFSRAARLVMGACGIRGAVSVAAALALPLNVPHRDLLIAVTTGVVLATLAPPALGLSWLMERLGLVEAEAKRRAEAEARLAVVNAALASIAAAAEEGELPERVLASLRDRYQLRAEQLEQQRLEDRPAGEGDGTPPSGAALRDLRRRVLAAQRATLRDLERRRRVDGALADRIEQELDLEAARFTR